MPILRLIRGLPGTGKSTYARDLSKRLNLKHFEADMFFCDALGNYKFDPVLLKDAHAWCLEETRHALSQGHGVVVSNTFTQLWEMQPYFDLSRESLQFESPSPGLFVSSYKIHVTVKEMPPTIHGNPHNVPDETIRKMYKRWEKLST